MASRPAHFLHIGKTGGSALVNAVKAIGGEQHIHLHGHGVRLNDVPAGEGVVLFLRDPVTRFTSAFYSRFRQGLPLSHRPWRPAEAVAFAVFTTPNALGEGLVSEDPAVREAAEDAMRGIVHVNSSFYDWVISDAYFDSRESDLVYVGFQETYLSDFARLLDMGVLPHGAVPPDDAVLAHRTPEGFDRRLSARAVAAIRDWYARDLDFYRKCASLRARLWPDADRPPAV